MVFIINNATKQVYPKYHVGTKDEKKFFRVNIEGIKYFFEDKEEYLRYSNQASGDDKKGDSKTMEQFILKAIN
jgi:hypothetical protein